MAKYEVGQKFIDIEDNAILTILGIAPELDYEGDQTYWLKSESEEEGLYYFVWDEGLLDRFCETIQLV